ncbi:hypothetical protein EYF80_058152 [Liparis tanakae]|uniref:Uncharacterized protein n=1 Tax=Liparis tanakae TaxID=230148 RepID=A0A4Z2ESX8_9TELE|nr:hypothetical protein EYF80_058152 [Liparis tanakae]
MLHVSSSSRLIRDNGPACTSAMTGPRRQSNAETAAAAAGEKRNLTRPTGSRRMGSGVALGPRCRASPGLSSLYLGCSSMLFGPAGLAGLKIP